jgi:hypothetical protein
MSNQNIPPDAAAAIDSYTQQSIAKINDNANLLFSRIAEANARALSAAKDLEKLGKSSGRQFESAMDAASRVHTAASSLDERVKVAQNDIEELLHDLSIARSGVDGINGIIGKVVRLKSDVHSTMTAAKLADDGGILCVCWTRKGLKQISIPMAALEVVSDGL